MKSKNPILNTVFAHIQHFLKKSRRDNISALAGQSSFFILLSVLPLSMFVFSLYSIVSGQSIDTLSVLNSMQFPEVGSEYIVPIIRYIEKSILSSGSQTTIITLVVTLWSAGKGIYAISEGIGRIYRIPNTRFWVFKRVFAMGYTIVMMGLVLLCLIVLVADSFVVGVISSLFDSTAFRWLLSFLSHLLIGVLLAFLLSLVVKLYLMRKIKNKRFYSIRALFPGMALTVLAWELLDLGLIVYLRRFATSSIYGSLGSICVLIVWMYFMTNALLYGVQLNYIYRGAFCEKGWFQKMRTELREQKKKKDPTPGSSE